MKTIYRAKDGEEFQHEFQCQAHERKLDGLVFACPRCNGEGVEKSVREIPGDPDVGPFLAGGRTEYETTEWTCGLCHGRAYRKTPWVPVMKRVVDYYTNAEDKQP